MYDLLLIAQQKRIDLPDTFVNRLAIFKAVAYSVGRRVDFFVDFPMRPAYCF